MDNSMLHSVLIVIVVALVTLLIRLLPFLIFHGEKKTPEIISYLGTVLPYAIMGMLVVYCLKGISLTAAPHGLPELISCVLIVLLHCWKRNTLLSILGGTVVYILLVQFVFV